MKIIDHLVRRRESTTEFVDEVFKAEFRYRSRGRRIAICVKERRISQNELQDIFNEMRVEHGLTVFGQEIFILRAHDYVGLSQGSATRGLGARRFFKEMAQRKGETASLIAGRIPHRPAGVG